jgi:hypothetical protein
VHCTVDALVASLGLGLELFGPCAFVWDPRATSDGLYCGCVRSVVSCAFVASFHVRSWWA